MTTYTCPTLPDLLAALLHILPGDVAIVPPGDYVDWAFDLNRNGTAQSPVTIQLTGARFTGTSRINVRGDYNLVLGGEYISCGTSGTPIIANNPQASGNEYRGIKFRDSRGISIKFIANSTLAPRDCIVRRCEFRDIPSTTSETLQIGQGTNFLASCWIKAIENLFVNVRTGDETISLKLSDCSLIGNVAYNCKGRFSLRAGNRNMALDNVAINCDGVVGVNGIGPVVFGNIGINCGFGIAMMAKYGSRAGCFDGTIKNNTLINCVGPIQFRKDDGATPLVDFPRGNLIENNNAFPEPWSIIDIGIPEFPVADIIAANTVVGGNHT